MRHRLLGVLVAVAAVLGTASVLSAHHSVAGQFDLSKQVTLKGTISKVDWVNPHIIVHVDVDCYVRIRAAKIGEHRLDHERHRNARH